MAPHAAPDAAGGPGRALPWALALALALPACVTERVSPQPTTWSLAADGAEVAVGPVPQQAGDVGAPDDSELLRLLSTPASPADLDPDFLADQPPSPFHRLGPNVIRGMDGSWTKIYMLRAGRGLSVIELLKAYVPGFPEAPGVANDPELPPGERIRWALHAGFVKDELAETFGERKTQASSDLADVLHVTAPPETLLFVTELLHKVLADLPQIELEVRVVEINLDDTLEWDAKTIITELTDRTMPYDPVTNPPEGNFGAGVPILDNNQPTGAGAGFNSFGGSVSLSGFLLSLQGVHDNFRLDTALGLLQTLGAAEIISSPTVSVLNGHRARLITGDKVPVFEAAGNVNNPTVVTKFYDTGVEIELVPFIVSEDLVRIDLSVNVSAQTGNVPFVINDVEVTSPIISQRAAGTTVHVYHEQVFAIGGLKARQQIETITKVPVLGDIPVLGWLFKSRTSRQQNTEILFFITPKIHVPSETLIHPFGP